MCHISYLLLNERTKLSENKESYEYGLQYKFDNYFTNNKNEHERAIGLYENDVRELYKKYNLKIKEPIFYGLWIEKKSIIHQDIISAVKI